jgi:TetR/AcrR family transcriptional regulator of autoinduction and epiphytic fitness
VIEPSAAVSDGRLARGVRARAAVVDAYLDLINEGDLRPTAARVAGRAGVSLRLVFHHYADLEALYAEAADRQARRLKPLMRPIDPALPRDARIAAFIARRARLLETIAPVRRAALLQEPFSPTLSRRLAEARAMTRAEVGRTFERELAACPPRLRAETFAALDAACSFVTWESLRRHQGLSPQRARAVMERMVRALLANRDASVTAAKRRRGG